MTVIDVYLNIHLSGVKETAVHQWPVNGRKANDYSQPEGSDPTTTWELCVLINVRNCTEHLGLLTSIKQRASEWSWNQDLGSCSRRKKLWSDNQCQECKYKKGISASDIWEFPCAFQLTVCKVNNVEVIHFVVLITRTCFVTFVTAHVWRLSEVSGLCHWGQTEISLVFTHSVLLICFVQAWFFFKEILLIHVTFPYLL